MGPDARCHAVPLDGWDLRAQHVVREPVRDLLHLGAGVTDRDPKRVGGDDPSADVGAGLGKALMACERVSDADTRPAGAE